jgi:RNA polymerase sigma factor (sigma-70 family)
MSQAHPTLEELARRAVDGDREAVRMLVRALQDDVFQVALRVLWNREDAADATQEILIRAVTRLARFDHASRVKTWVYRVAANYLLDVKRSAVERQRLTFDAFADDLEVGLSRDGPADVEISLLTADVKIGCTLGMLQCLDRAHRLAYVLGEILELPACEAAQALNIEEAAFRKRLERARGRIEGFAKQHCGLVSDSAVCRCNARVPEALRLRRINADAPLFAQRPESFEQARSLVRKMEATRRALEVHRSTRPRPSDIDFARRVVSALDAESKD